MNEIIRVGIIICNRYHACGGGKCIRALRNREGAFSRYQGKDVELVGYTTCGGCPGGNVEYAPAEMKRNGANVIHLATGLIVGYPPCPNIDHFCRMISMKHQLQVIVGTHPIPQDYFVAHTQLGTWDAPHWKALLQPTLTDEKARAYYD